MKGVVVKFKRLAGWGFIRVEGVRNDFFCHVSQVVDGKPLVVGQTVEFEPAEGDRGPEARRVVPGRRPFSPTFFYGVCGLVVSLGLTGLAWLYLPFVGLPVAWCIAASLISFVLYGVDKGFARLGRNRIPEKVLHGMAFVGGSPGAYAAMRIFRHKTLKGSFRFFFWAIVVIQVGLFVAYLVYWPEPEPEPGQPARREGSDR